MAEAKRGVPTTPEVKQRIAEIYGAGLSYKETAGAVGVSEKTVERVLSSDKEPQWRKLADSLRNKRESISAQVRTVVQEMIEAEDHDGNPLSSVRARGVELYQKAPELFDAPDDEDAGVLPGVIFLFPVEFILHPEAAVIFSPDDLAQA